MKIGIAAALTICLSGCLLDVLMTGAISADLASQQAGSAMGNLNQVQLDTDQMLLQEALEYYYVDNEAYPRTLSELAPKFIDTIPTRPDGGVFGYNPLEGTIYANDKGPAPEDYFLMEDIKTAINTFGNSTGFYPPKLDDLYPRYMQTLPRTNAGVEFGYDNQNGRVTHPHEGRQFEERAPEQQGGQGKVIPMNAIGSLQEGDLKDSDKLNKALDRMGY